jgi:hypothetical protein
MTRLQLTLYIAPGQAEITCNLKRKDATYERITAAIDTGAEVSLLPLRLLGSLEHRLSEEGKVTITQAGMAQRDFEASEAYVTIFFDDSAGNQTEPFEILAWFTVTRQALIGFEGILDRSVLHIDMPQRTGWLEIDAQ